MAGFAEQEEEWEQLVPGKEKISPGHWKKRRHHLVWEKQGSRSGPQPPLAPVTSDMSEHREPGASLAPAVLGWVVLG